MCLHIPDGDTAEKRTVEGVQMSVKNILGGKNRVALAGFFLACTMTVFQLVVALFPMLPYEHALVIIGAATILVPVYYTSKSKKGMTFGWVEFIWVALAIVTIGYFFTQGDSYLYRQGVDYTLPDVIFAALLIVVCLEASRRTCGLALTLVAVFFIVYGLIGHYFPRPFMIRRIDCGRLFTGIVGLDGLYGVPIQAVVRFVYLYVMFGSLLTLTGGAELFLDLATALTGGTRGGPAKIAVISSALFGTVSGNSQANVMTTGSFTIPMMKRMGYNPSFAGAVEAVASTGGQLTPPILGAAAFVMAEMIGVPYFEIVIATIIPALLYYFAIFRVIDMEAIRLSLRGLSLSEVPPLKRIMSERGHMLLPLVVMITALVGFHLSPKLAGLYALAATAIASFTKPSTRLTPEKFIKVLEDTAINALPVITACATAGLVIGVLAMTGLGIKFASAVISLAKGNLLLALILSAVTSLILGMGLPTTASYVITAVVAVPSLVQLGIGVLPANLFVFYFACLSSITPPVALASFVAAGIAEAPMMRVGLDAVKLGLVAYVVPFMFVYSPELIAQGELTALALPLATALIGTWAFPIGIWGYYRGKKLNIISRIAILVGSLSLIKPGIKTDILGIALIFGMLMFELRTINVFRGTSGGIPDEARRASEEDV